MTRKKLDEKAFESVMMKEFEDLRLTSGIRIPQDPVQASYLGYRAGRMIQKDQVKKSNEEKREVSHVSE